MKYTTSFWTEAYALLDRCEYGRKVCQKCKRMERVKDGKKHKDAQQGTLVVRFCLVDGHARLMCTRCHKGPYAPRKMKPQEMMGKLF